MKLKQLLEGVPYQGEVGDIDITDVSCYSRQLTSGSAFVCIKGVQTDGHDYVNAALSKGCLLYTSRENKNRLFARSLNGATRWFIPSRRFC